MGLDCNLGYKYNSKVNRETVWFLMEERWKRDGSGYDEEFELNCHVTESLT